MKKEFKDLFLTQPQIVQERTWLHMNEWKNKIYIPLLNIPAHKQKDFGINAFSEKLSNLVNAVEKKDLAMCSTYHQTLGHIGKLNDMLSQSGSGNGFGHSNAKAVFFKRMFTGYRDCFGWTLLVSGHITDINDCFSNAIGFWNHYINSKGALVSEYRRDEWIDGHGYWPRVSGEILSTMGLERASKETVFEKMNARRELMAREALEHFVNLCVLLKYEEAVTEGFRWLEKEAPALNKNERNARNYKYRHSKFWGIYAPGNEGSFSAGVDSRRWEEYGRKEVESVLEKMKLSKLLEQKPVDKENEKETPAREDSESKIEIKKVKFL